MDNDTQTKPLPEKVLRRHFELVNEALPEISQLALNDGRPADTLLNYFLRTHRELGSRDRRFLSQAVFAYFRWYGWTVAKLGLEPAEACLLGAILETAELHPSFQYMHTRCALPDGVEPIGDRALSEKCNAINSWFKESTNGTPLALADLLPAEFEEVVDPRAVDRCIAAFQQRPPAWIRARADAGSLEKALAKRGIPYQVHGQLKSAIAVESGVSLVHELKDHTGQFIVQDITSQCVGIVCTPSPDQDWWDCCAGAGGKAMHLEDLMGRDGKVLATDIRHEALKELKKRARRYGIRNIRTQPFNAVSDEPFTKTFDGVLVDAPCSGWGTWGRNPDARWRTSRREVVQSANRQLKILNNAKWCVKPGGTLVYAVCTLTRPETEEVVMNFLDHHPNFKLDPFTDPLTGNPTDGQLQIWPWDGPGDAMFIARFRRSE